MRQLASVQKIVDIQPIEGADAIEVATVLAWKVVVKKNEFKVGDLVVYCEIDSWIPHELAPFLSKGQDPREYNNIKGERLKTIRLRGQVSQGLILPSNILTNGDNVAYTLTEGDDVTDALTIQKWEAPISAQLSGMAKGNFPSEIPKTDQDRVQSMRNKDFVPMLDMQFELTEKLEGSSCTMAILNGEFIVCSRNINLKETEGNTFWTMARKYDVEQKMRNAGWDNIAIQGEVIGESIQQNHYNIKGQEFQVFDLYNIATGEYYKPQDRWDIIKGFGLTHVPVLATGKLREFGATQQALVDFADGKSVLNKDKLREGVVFKSLTTSDHFKAVSNKYLEKTGN